MGCLCLDTFQHGVLTLFSYGLCSEFYCMLISQFIGLIYVCVLDLFCYGFDISLHVGLRLCMRDGVEDRVHLSCL